MSKRRAFVSRDIVVHDDPRRSLRALAKQYFHYGYRRARRLPTEEARAQRGGPLPAPGAGKGPESAVAATLARCDFPGGERMR